MAQPNILFTDERLRRLALLGTTVSYAPLHRLSLIPRAKIETIYNIHNRRVKFRRCPNLDSFYITTAPQATRAPPPIAPAIADSTAIMSLSHQDILFSFIQQNSLIDYKYVSATSSTHIPFPDVLSTYVWSLSLNANVARENREYCGFEGRSKYIAIA